MKYVFKEKGSDVDFMPDVLAADLMREKALPRILLWTTALLFLTLIIWTALAEVDELSRGEGKVIPSSQIQKIAHLEGGIIKEILVRERDIVAKGQVLVRIDNTVAEANLTEGKTLYYRYLATVARLRAQIEEKPFVLPDEVEKNAPGEGKDAMRLYKARMESLANERRIAEQDVEQKRQELNDQSSRAVELQKQLELIQKKIDIVEPLVEKGVEPKIALIDLNREISQTRADLSTVKANILKAQAGLDQNLDRLKQVGVKYKAEDWNELKDANNRLANAQGTFVTGTDRANRTEVRSPVRGIIKQLYKTTVGGVVQPGENIIEIVPLEDTLLIEAKVKPQDIAFLRPGLSASVKITAYDSSIYGDMKAELVGISADSITDDKGNTFYKAYIRTKDNKLSKSRQSVPIIPGMVATVDILTGKKTILDYLLKPLIKAKEHALTER